MTFSKILSAGILSMVGLSASVAQAKSTTDTSNYRSKGAYFQFEAPAQCGTNEYGAPLFSSLGLAIITQTVDFNGSSTQADVQSTQVNISYYNPCTQLSGFAYGQTDYNPNNLVSIDNSSVSANLKTATFSATVPVLFDTYDGNTGTFGECAIQAVVSAVLQSTATPTTSTVNIVANEPAFHSVYHANGKVVDATGNFTVQFIATPGCNLAALPPVLAAAAQSGSIVDSHDASMQVTHNHGKP
jgi:hypothetical protein